MWKKPTWFSSLLWASLVCGAPTLAQQNVPVLKLDRHDLTILGATIGESTRSQVQKALGQAPVFKVGHGEEADDAICYRSAVKNDDTVVVFQFGALGGWIDLTQIAVSKASALSLPATNCVSSTSISRDTEFLRGLKLGITSGEVVAALGPPLHSTKTTVSYYVSRSCESDGPKPEPRKNGRASPCVVVDSVEARFTAKGALVHISFYHFIER